MFRFIQKWHTKLGIFIAIFVVLLVITGIAINHSNELGLNKRFIQNEFLLDIYQIKPASEPIGFNIDTHWVVQVGERIYFDEIEIAKEVKNLIGAIKVSDMYIVAYDTQLVLLTESGELIEILSGAEGVPSGMNTLGQDEQGKIVIKASHGFYHVDLDELDWEEYDYLEANWSESSLIPEQLNAVLLKKYRGSGLSLERVLFDLHSGRIAGKAGVYFVDLVAVLLLFLAISGFWMWMKRK